MPCGLLTFSRPDLFYYGIGSALLASVAGGTDADFTGCTALSRHSADGVLRAVCDGAHGEEGAAHDSRLPLKAPSLVVLGVFFLRLTYTSALSIGRSDFFGY